MIQKFLIIDNEEAHRIIYRTALENLIDRPVEVLEASNTADGYRIMQENDLAAVVLDNQLPGDTGFRLLYELYKDMPNHPPVIFFSAAMTEELARNAMALGAAATLQKDKCDPVEVVQMIEGIINERDKEQSGAGV